MPDIAKPKNRTQGFPSKTNGRRTSLIRKRVKQDRQNTLLLNFAAACATANWSRRHSKNFTLPRPRSVIASLCPCSPETAQ